MNRTLYVVARNHRAFEDWCWKQSPNEDLSGVKFVASVKTLAFETQGARFLFLTGWMERADWRQIYNRAIALGERPS
jgi:hypothetical protein